MNDEDFVSYEIAVKLKKLGFDWPCYHFYQCYDDGRHKLHRNCCKGNLNILDRNVEIFLKTGFVYSAPTLTQAQKWLRERGLCVSVYPSPFSEDIDGEYAYKVYQFKDYEEWNDPCAEYAKDYNSALSAGIETALKLIENNKNHSDN